MQRNLPKEIFLHLLSVSTLYMSAINVLQLIWQAINKWVPDALAAFSYEHAYSVGVVRFALASIIVVFPVYLLSMWLLQREYHTNAESSRSKFRKWLMYATLFIAALILIGDLVIILRTFFEGELTVRFILKALSVLFVAGALFALYFWDIRTLDKNVATVKKMKWIALSATFFVCAVVIVGFFLIGSPKKERLARFDQQKVNDLQTIQWEIVEYWRAKQALPILLNDLSNPLRGFTVPLDPQTKESYGYEVFELRGKETFALCAVFNLASDTTKTEKSLYLESPFPGGNGIQGNSSWNHEAGKVCFERTIDPAFFPPLKD